MSSDGRTIVVGMSGGVDSAVAAALLLEAGCRVIGVTLILWKGDEDETARWQDRSCCKVGLARHVCRQLDIPHHTLDIQAEFKREIIDDFCDTYLVGQTPNPCVRCNERMKFGRLIDVARDLGADRVATGHYARIAHSPDTGYSLLRSADSRKDQTYFLYRLNQARLASIDFPLGGMTKEAVYQKAAQLGLPYEEILESQEVCFVTQTDYRAFLSEHRPEVDAPGKIVTESGEALGTHGGIALYTIGQRRGLGVAAAERLYVTRLDAERREVVVGPEESLARQEMWVRDLVWGGSGVPDGPIRVSAQLRYRASAQLALLTPCSDGSVGLCFDHPQRGVAPGQSAVFYAGDTVLGGGIIAAAS